EADARLMAHAVFGLLNSTPHSLKTGDGKAARAARSRAVMRAMTVAALSMGAELQ
ncbi:MAG TPA: TetR/AcrR family transcriptional regulator, partial [Mycobacterium sp.]